MPTFIIISRRLGLLGRNHRTDMKNFSLLLLAAACCSANVVNGEKCEPSVTRSGTIKGPICKGALIFEDDFETPDLDFDKWSYEITMATGNVEHQVYWAEPENSFISDGNLTIHPAMLADVYGEDFLYNGTLDLGPNCTQAWNSGCERTGNSESILNPATSARLHTIDTFGFTYGKVEVRARIPVGDWIWPAIWMMPVADTYGEWPRSGEIDIMESRGNREYFLDNGVNIGVEQFGATIHWGPDGGHNHYPETHWERNTAPEEGWNEDFHLYQFEWTPDNIKFGIDDVVIGTVAPPDGGFYELGNFANEGLANPWADGAKMAPFDQDFYLILNVAVGGNNGYFPDGISNPGGKPWINNSPVAFRDFWENRAQWEPTWQGDTIDMLVDYVRVWAL